MTRIHLPDSPEHDLAVLRLAEPVETDRRRDIPRSCVPVTWCGLLPATPAWSDRLGMVAGAIETGAARALGID